MTENIEGDIRVDNFNIFGACVKQIRGAIRKLSYIRHRKSKLFTFSEKMNNALEKSLTFTSPSYFKIIFQLISSVNLVTDLRCPNFGLNSTLLGIQEMLILDPHPRWRKSALTLYDAHLSFNRRSFLNKFHRIVNN